MVGLHEPIRTSRILRLNLKAWCDTYAPSMICGSVRLCQLFGTLNSIQTRGAEGRKVKEEDIVILGPLF